MHVDEQLSGVGVLVAGDDRGLADEVTGVHVAPLAEAGFDRIGVVVGVGAIRQQAVLDAFHLVRGSGGDPVRLAGCEGEIPQLLTATAVGQEEFEAALTAPAGSHDDHRDALELDFAELEEADLVDDVAEQVTNEILGFGPLDRERRDIGLADGDVETLCAGDTLAEQGDVAVGNRQPPQVLTDRHRDRVVDQDAVVVGHRRVAASADLQGREVAARDIVGEGAGVGAFDLDLTLGADVPDRHTGHQALVFAESVAVARRHVHAVVDRVVGRARCGRGGVERRLLDPRTDRDLGHPVRLSALFSLGLMDGILPLICRRRVGRYQKLVPGSPLNGPTTSLVIQPP